MPPSLTPIAWLPSLTGVSRFRFDEDQRHFP